MDEAKHCSSDPASSDPPDNEPAGNIVSHPMRLPVLVEKLNSLRAQLGQSQETALARIQSLICQIECMRQDDIASVVNSALAELEQLQRDMKSLGLQNSIDADVFHKLVERIEKISVLFILKNTMVFLKRLDT